MLICLGYTLLKEVSCVSSSDCSYWESTYIKHRQFFPYFLVTMASGGDCVSLEVIKITVALYLWNNWTFTFFSLKDIDLMRKAVFFLFFCFSIHMAAMLSLAYIFYSRWAFLFGRCAEKYKGLLLAYLKFSLTHPFLRCFSVFYVGVFVFVLFSSYNCISAGTLCYRCCYATEILNAISVLK